MKANELRIGNLINEFGLPIFVTGAIIDRLQQIEQNNKTCIDLSPIPLTEEWLLRFGFIYEKEHELFNGLTLNLNDWVQFYADNQTNYNGVTLFVGLRDIDEDFNPQYGVTYVHQLQNIYFALTGTELMV